MKKIMIACGHHITAYGLMALIDRDLPGYTAAQVRISDIPHVLLGEVPCDLLVLIGDGHGGRAGISAKPMAPILHITDGLGFTGVQALYGAGARGVVDISNTASTVIGAIGEVLEGHLYLEQSFKEELLKGTGGRPQSGVPANPLTKREREVAELMLDGKKMCEIGECLGLKASTVTTFKTKVFKKLCVDNLIALKEVYGPHGARRA